MRRHSSLGKELSITLFMIRDKNVMVEFKDLLLRGKVISVGGKQQCKIYLVWDG